ncbi:hypothetical protein RFI_32470, partial [Reticulomyxa filosa]
DIGKKGKGKNVIIRKKRYRKNKKKEINIFFFICLFEKKINFDFSQKYSLELLRVHQDGIGKCFAWNYIRSRSLERIIVINIQTGKSSLNNCPGHSPFAIINLKFNSAYINVTGKVSTMQHIHSHNCKCDEEERSNIVVRAVYQIAAGLMIDIIKSGPQCNEKMAQADAMECVHLFNICY